LGVAGRHYLRLALAICVRRIKRDTFDAVFIEYHLRQHGGAIVVWKIEHPVGRQSFGLDVKPPQPPLIAMLRLNQIGMSAGARAHEIADAVETDFTFVDLNGLKAMRVMPQDQISTRIDRGMRDDRLIVANRLRQVMQSPVYRHYDHISLLFRLFYVFLQRP